jgi:hypothetical protein
MKKAPPKPAPPPDGIEVVYKALAPGITHREVSHGTVKAFVTGNQIAPTKSAIDIAR